MASLADLAQPLDDGPRDYDRLVERIGGSS
jgi:hypothetical protein